MWQYNTFTFTVVLKPRVVALAGEGVCGAEIRVVTLDDYLRCCPRCWNHMLVVVWVAVCGAETLGRLNAVHNLPFAAGGEAHKAHARLECKHRGGEERRRTGWAKDSRLKLFQPQEKPSYAWISTEPPSSCLCSRPSLAGSPHTSTACMWYQAHSALLVVLQRTV